MDAAGSLRGHLVRGRAGLASLLLGPSPWPPLVSDLHLGEWRPMQLAAELAAQLSLPLAGLPRPSEIADEIGPETVSAWVDLEGLGDLSVRRAYAAAQQIGDALRNRPGVRVFAVIPADAALWSRESEWLLHFLARLWSTEDLQLITFAEEAPALPCGLSVQWHVLDPAADLSPEAAMLVRPAPAPAAPETARLLYAAVVPGLLSFPLSRALGLTPRDAECALALPTGIGIVDPESRMAAASARAELLPPLAAPAASIPWLADYMAFHDPAAAPERLVQAAWRSFAEGACDLARRFAAEAHRRGATAETYRCLQTLGLVAQSYRSMARIPAPQNLDETTQRRLARFQAWGQTLSGEAESALTLFEEALKAADPAEPRWLTLYMRNIRALALARTGRRHEALDEELAIRAALARTTAADALHYLNALNLSRLYRAAGDLDAARLWLDRAEAATAGVAVMADTVHFAALRARLCEDGRDPAAARRHWQAAALAFSALEPPEALCWRVAGLLQGGVSEEGADVDACARGLAEMLDFDAVDPSTAEVITVLDSELHPPPTGCTVVAGAGWGVLASPQAAPSPFDSPAHRRLRAGLRRSLPGLSRGTRTVWVLRRPDGNFPDSLDDALSPALWHGATGLIWDGAVQDLATTLERADQRLRLGPGVAEHGGGIVRFRRYRPKRRLSPEDEDALALCGHSIQDIDPALDSVLARLIFDGVLALETTIAPLPVKRFRQDA